MNLGFIEALRLAWDSACAMWIRVANPVGYREIFVEQGDLVGSSSTTVEDRLSVLLAAEGWYEEALLDPLFRRARSEGVPLGELLVREGLLSTGELAAVLQRQALTRFTRMLTMPGLVTAGEGAERNARSEPLGALVVESLQALRPLSALRPLVAELEAHRLRPTALAERLPQLGLSATEVFSLRSLMRQEHGAFEAAGIPEESLRLASSLFALGVIAPG
jgi:hypothetical protein